MSSFTERPLLTPLPCGKKWVVRKEFYYDVGYKGSDDRITIPAGFITDLATSPRILWSIIPPFGRYLSPSILHDYLYFSKEVSRKKSDEIFYEAMLISGVKKWKAKIMYLTVRLFGRGSYKIGEKK